MNYTPIEVFYKIIYVYDGFKHTIISKNPRQINIMEIDEYFVRGFFDGTSQGNPSICGVGATLFFSPFYCYIFKENLGIGRDN
jgi:hypothetical protein